MKQTFRVWAPKADRVDLLVGTDRYAMDRTADGWASRTVDLTSGDERYAFALDDGPPLPDPRSPRQPRGIHEWSQRVRHEEFHWTDEGWRAPPLTSGIVYELHVGTFSEAGTFDGVADHLDHLVDLGVTHVELMPVCPFSGRWGWGYDGVFPFAVHEPYGGPTGLKRLVDACHGRGLAVLLDVVHNHLGPTGNYLGQYGPYFTDKYHTPWGAAVNFDGPHSDEVRRYFCEAARMWLADYHLDGLRLDAVHAIFDQSARPFLEQLAEEVDELQGQLERPLVLVAESDLNDPRLVRSRAAGGLGMTAQWSDDFHHALHAVLTGEAEGYYGDFGALGDVAKALTDTFVYDGRYSSFRRRSHGRPVQTLPGTHFLGYLQTHDQVGNRAVGERTSHLLSPARLRIGAALVLTAPFVPMLFQGEEWGASTPFQYFTDHEDPTLAEAVRGGRRREFAAFGWRAEDVPDPQAPETYARSRLDWSERARAPHDDLLAWHRALIALRRDEPALTDGRVDRVAADERERWLSMERGAIAVLVNLDDSPHSLPCAGASDAEILLYSTDARPRPDADCVSLPPESVAILRRRT